MTYLWPIRRTLKARQDFGQTIEERGHAWWEHSMFFPDRFRTRLALAMAEIASHNHFVLDRGGKVFKQTAPIIKLPAEATEDEHLALVAYLNSSVAEFFFQQVGMNKGGPGGGSSKGEKWRDFYVRNAAVCGSLPIPHNIALLSDFGRHMSALVERRRSTHPGSALANAGPATFATARESYESFTLEMVALQEDIDWEVYRLFGFGGVRVNAHGAIAPEERLFETMAADRVRNGSEVTRWFDDFRRGVVPSAGVSIADVEEQRKRTERAVLLGSSPEIALVENFRFKRRWEPFDWDAAAAIAARHFLLDAIEAIYEARRADARPLSARAVTREVEQQPKLRAVAEYLLGTTSSDVEALVGELMGKEAVASATAQVFTDAGIEKRRVWEGTWDLQRREDAGEKGLTIPVPQKYDKDDFEKAATVWGHRGKLDVPKERFIAYPTATPPPGASGPAALVFGWAGWTQLEQLQAAIALWQDEWGEHGNKLLPRTTREAADQAGDEVVADTATRGKLLPILQTMVDLLPWVRQWHNDDGETADQFDSYVDEQCLLLEMSREDVHLWRFPPRVKKATKKAAPKKATAKNGPKKKAGAPATDEE